MIEARGLSKRFHDRKRGEIRAVDNVSFTCHPGRIYGLLGANGAGKTTSLDVMTARAIITFISDCRDHGKAIIFSTHIMSEVERLCDHIGIIHEGKLMADGTVSELRAKYAEHNLEEIIVKVVGPLLKNSEA